MTAALLSLALLAADAGRPDLVGRVTDAKGAPVAGAHVLIDSAAVRRGTSPLCPSCYADCRKRAETDEAGAFRIASLDPELTFRVLVVADGFRTTFAEKADPAAGPIKVALTPFDPGRIDPKRLLRGVVLDPDGRPLVGARVSPKMFATEAFSGFSPDIFDPVALTDLRGEFALVSRSPIDSADLLVEGNGVAPRIVPRCRPEANPQRLATTRGAAVTGRVVRDGKPVAGVAVGLVQASRDSRTFLGVAEIGTDKDGRFAFPNVHPDDDYLVYCLMASLKERDGGAVAARPIRVGADGSTTEAGDLPVEPGHRVSGRVLLSDGKAIPPKTRLLVSREGAWDSQTVELDREGRFALAGLPTERYAININLKGYRISSKNRSSDPNNPWRLVGTIDQDIKELKILMEPGER